MLKELKCEHKNKKGEVCGYTWFPRVENPKLCPLCKSKRPRHYKVKKKQDE